MTAQADISFVKEKLTELIVYFAEKGKDDNYLGATKLNKLLFLADFLAYGYLGVPITGATYIHQKLGPTPDPQQFLPALRELIESEDLVQIEHLTISGPMKKPVAKRRPKTEIFSREELELADEAFETLRHMTNSEAKLWSHNFVGWRFTEGKEVIPYGTAFLWNGVPVTKEAYAWADEVATALGY